ncbi:MAG: hypothetical protein ICV66_09915, partial [Chitinophagaceae bacterium]|nr:hypothetical protein [Chitinophagaceae bacterium]
ARHIAIKDGDKVLRQWNFTDATGANVFMTCKVKDIADLQKNHKLQLYYSSKELPEGRLLASITFVGNNKVAP